MTWSPLDPTQRTSRRPTVRLVCPTCHVPREIYLDEAYACTCGFVFAALLPGAPPPPPSQRPMESDRAYAARLAGAPPPFEWPRGLGLALKLMAAMTIAAAVSWGMVYYVAEWRR